MGGSLYGYDIGIIGSALLYLDRTIRLSEAQESLVVAAVLGGGAVSSLLAGGLADWIGRKRLMLLAGALFAASVGLIVGARGFPMLFTGRALQGLSAGMIAVVIPLHLAECLPAGFRGRGTAAFQLLLTVGILAAEAVGAHYARGVDAAVAAAGPAAMLPAADAAWRAMFRSALYPALVFLAGAAFATESPRWLYARGRPEAALAALRRSRPEAEAQAEFRAMGAALAPPDPSERSSDTLWQRRYVVPFLLACAVLGLTQATGINSILQFVVVILRKSGLPGAAAAQRATLVTGANVAFTLVGMLLVDRIGRKALLRIGTAGIAVSLSASAIVFRLVEAGRPPAAAGDLVTGCLVLFISSFAIGPGVCVWLALSELMPTRIRSVGMGLGLLVNQGVSTGIAALFLPVVSRWGYSGIFGFWSACAVGYFAVATWLLPETKGRTLEEIEAGFRR
jgi:sugar porter (SP) family MFS transporter